MAQTVRHAFPFDPAQCASDLPRPWLWRNGRERIQVPAECVEHFGEPPDHQQMVSDYAAVGSPAEWARRCGKAIGHDPKTWEATEVLLTFGTRKLDTTSVALRGFRRLCPTATAGAFWIFQAHRAQQQRQVVPRIAKMPSSRP